jgi:hypothetical protein
VALTTRVKATIVRGFLVLALCTLVFALTGVAQSAKAADSVVALMGDPLLVSPCCLLVQASLDGGVMATYNTNTTLSDGTTLDDFGGQSMSVARDGTVVFTPDPSGGFMTQPWWRPIGGIWLVTPLHQPRQLTRSYLDADPAISPDGKLVAFERWDPANSRADIFTINADGTNLRQLTDAGATEASYDYPQFSPNNIWIAYSCSRGGTVTGRLDPLPCGPAITGDRSYFGLMLMTADGAHQHTIVEGSAGPTAWAPDGKSLLAPGVVGNVADFVRYNSDGSDLFAGASAPVLIASDNLLPGTPPSFSTDGSEVMVGLYPSVDPSTGKRNTEWLINAGGGAPQRTALFFDSSGYFLPAATGGGPPPTVAPKVTVPHVEGTKVPLAERRIRARHLRVGRVLRKESKTVARGRIIRQIPRAGRVRPAGSVVRLVVSSGRTRHH